MRSVRSLFAAAMGIALTFALSPAASATTLTTPALFLGGPSAQNVCVVVNVGSAPIQVTIDMIGLLSTSSATCTVPPDDINNDCEVPLNDFAFCRVTTTSKRSTRAVMINRQITSPFTIFATVEAH